MMSDNFSRAGSNPSSFLLISTLLHEEAFFFTARFVLKRLNHCHETLKTEPKVDNVETIPFAFAMARDGDTWSLARRMLSIQMYNIYSNLENRPTEALKVFCLASSKSKADLSRLKYCFFHSFPYSAFAKLILTR